MRAEQFIFIMLQMVQACGSPAGQALVCRDNQQRQFQALCYLRRGICAKVEQRQILREMRQSGSQEEKGGIRAQTQTESGHLGCSKQRKNVVLNL